MTDEIMLEFVNESREHLATIEADLLAIEEAGANADDELLNKVFRAAHSIKGAAGFLDLKQVRELAHKAETVLDMLRSRQVVPNVEITNVLLRAFDRLRDLINNASESNAADIAGELLALQELASSYTPEPKKSLLDSEVAIPGAASGSSVTIAAVDLERIRREHHQLWRITLDLIHDVDRQGKQVLLVFRELSHAGEIIDCALDFEKVGDLFGPILTSVPLELIFGSGRGGNEIAEILGITPDRMQTLEVERGMPQPDRPRGVLETLEVKQLDHPEAPVQAATPQATERTSATNAGSANSNAPVAADETLRVNVALLDTLMNLAGELVLSRNQFQAAITQKNFRMLTSAGQRLSQVTSEMQDAIMRTRLQPIENVFSRLPRVVRDLSNSLGKEVRLELGGRDVALDRSLLEGLSDPLTHMVRNAIDHGIESPEVRTKSGKSRTGVLSVEARHEAGQIVIEIADDGSGIDHEKVAKAARAKGLITDEQLKGMTSDERAALIMLPGLSTAEQVTQVSGRGVGMDVVKTNLDRLGGQIEITTKRGEGTRFRIKLPLTLTIIPALIVSVSGERFAIPQINVEELLRIRGEDRKRRIEVIGGTDVLVLRDRILPLLRLSDFLGIGRTFVDEKGMRRTDRRRTVADRRSPRHDFHEIGSVESADDAENRRSLPDRRRNSSNALEIAVVTTGTFRYGLIVECFHNTEEIVVKPLGRDLKESREYAGATILGDGTVALIIDAAGLAAKTELSSVSASPRARQQEQQALDEAERHGASHSFLLFRNAPEEHCAVPLESVRRIERIKGTQIEWAGGKRTIRYRNSSLPLMALSDSASVGKIADGQDLAVIVSGLYGHEVGLLGAMPVDVHETDALIDTVTHRQQGIPGSAIILDHTTLLVDMAEIIERVYPEWRSSDSRVQTERKSTILLAEDSDFFRAQVKRFLEGDGHEVLEASDGEEAWNLLLKNWKKIRVLVTDIEMPRLSGLELSARVRGDERTRTLPIIAMSSLAGDEDVAKAQAAGVNQYQIKLDRDSLLLQVRRLTGEEAETSDSFQAVGA